MSFLIFNQILVELRQTKLRWADGSNVKREVDLQVIVLLGPKTEAELAPQPKKKAPKPEKEKPKVAEKQPNGKPAANSSELPKDEGVEGGAESIDELLKTRTHFHAVGQNFKTDGYVVTPKTMKLLTNHVSIIGGKVSFFI